MTNPTDTTTRRTRPAGRRSRAKGPGMALATVGAVALVTAACGSSTPSASSSTTTTASGGGSSASATVHTISTSAGKVLANSAGMALYTLGTDHGGQSTCTGQCISAWPPLTVPAGTTPTGAAGVGGTLGTAKQADGTEIVTYNGKLLYTFVSDTSPGQVTGNGVAGFSVATVSSSGASTTTSTTSRSGY